MSKQHTDSSIIEHHEDGSWTESTVITHYPATRAQKATAWAALGGLCLAPFAPLVALYVTEKWDERRQRKQADKKPEPLKVD